DPIPSFFAPFPHPYPAYPYLHSFPTRRSSDLASQSTGSPRTTPMASSPSRSPWPTTPSRARSPSRTPTVDGPAPSSPPTRPRPRSEEHTSELQSRFDLVCRLLLAKKKRYNYML